MAGRWYPMEWFARFRSISEAGDVLDSVRPTWIVGAEPASWSRLPFSRRELRESTTGAGGASTTSVVEITADPGYYVDVHKVWSDVTINWRRDASPLGSTFPATIWEDRKFTGGHEGFVVTSGTPLTANLNGSAWTMDADYERGAIPAFGPWMRVDPGKTLTLANASENAAHQIQLLLEAVRIG